MCAEFTYGPPMELQRLLDALIVVRKVIFEDFKGRVFPKGKAPIIVKNTDGAYECISAEFSLIPHWWDPTKSKSKSKSNRPPFATHNARLETVEEKPAFRDSFKKNHCLVPIYEFWESSLFGEKFAGHRIKFTTGSVILAAGCYSTWIDKSTGEVITSFTIITHNPSLQIFECGHDRMPVFLGPTEALEWLDNPKSDKNFLLKKNMNGTADFEITIDRPLKDGWQKNAPEEQDLKELKRIIS